MIEQCRPDRPDLLPVLWPLASDQPSELGLMLINFYITVQLLYNKKASLLNCDPNLVKIRPRIEKIMQPSSEVQLRPIVKIRAKKNLMAAGVFHVLLIRPKSGQLLSWGSTQSSVLGNSTKKLIFNLSIKYRQSFCCQAMSLNQLKRFITKRYPLCR